MVLLQLTAALVVVFLTPFVAWFWKMYKYRHINKLPGPKPLPLLGNMLEYGSDIVSILENMVKLTIDYGPIVRMWQGPFRLSLLITDPQKVEYFLTSTVHISKSSGYSMYKQWLGDGLLVSTGSKWKQHRKIITPTFHFKILDQFTQIYYTSGKTLVDKLNKTEDKNYVDLFKYINLYSLDVICETAMGIKMNAQIEEDIPYVRAVKGWLEIYMIRFFSLLYRNEFFFSFTKEYVKNKQYLTELKAFTTKVIDERKENRQRASPTEDTVDDFGAKKKIAFLDLLLDQQECSVLTDIEIREEVDTFMFEGHDTVTSAVCFALYEIAKHKNIQQNICEEITSYCGEDTDTHISIQDLQNMTYLDRVVKEVLRLYPSAPFIERETEEDIELDGIKIPSGTTISFLPYAMHRSEKLFPEPEKFDPDRFLPENTIGRHPFSYIPFSAGPRNCIGQRYAMNTVKATVAYVLRNFELSPVTPEHQLIIGNDAVLKSMNGFPVRLKERKLQS